MSLRCKSLVLLLSVTAVPGADKDAGAFRPQPAAAYANHQKVSGVAAAAEVYADAGKVKSAFGKVDPGKHGILPVLLVLENGSGKALRLDRMRVEYLRPDRKSLTPIPAADLPYLEGPRKPRTAPSPYPNPIPRLGGNKKHPLAAWEFEGRSFTARMLPAGEAAHGFYYYQTANLRGATLYVTGITEAATGQELFFIEIPLD